MSLETIDMDRLNIRPGDRLLDLGCDSQNKTKNFKVALSGGIDLKDIESNQDTYNKFDYIKTGLFTLDVKQEKDIINTIREKQLQEKEILKTMKDILLYKNQYISSRYIHLENYIKKK